MNETLMAWGVIGIMGASLALAGCPKKDADAGDAAPSASASAVATTTPSATPADTMTDSGKVVPRVVLPHLDGGPILGDAALPTMDAAMPAMDAAMPASDAAAPSTTMPAECDQYFAKNEACIAKMPVATQGAGRAAMAAQKGGWTSLLASGARDHVVAQCKQSLAGVTANPLCK
jgi:hypothetical protein